MQVRPERSCIPGQGCRGGSAPQLVTLEATSDSPAEYGTKAEKIPGNISIQKEAEARQMKLDGKRFEIKDKINRNSTYTEEGGGRGR